MENCRFTASKWRVELLEFQVSQLSKRLTLLSKSQMWLSIALAIVSFALLFHIIFLHLL